MKKFLLALALALLPSWASAAPPAFVTAGTLVASTGVDVTVTIPAGCNVDGYLLLISGLVRDVDDTITPTATANTWTQLGGSCTSACNPNIERSTTSSYWAFYFQKTGTLDTTVLIDKSTATGDTYFNVVCYSGVDTSTPIEVTGSWSTGTADPATATAITTLTDDSLVVVTANGEDNNNGAITTTGTDPAAYTEHYGESATGTDGCLTVSEAARTLAGATGTISVDWDTAVPVGWASVAIALKPPPPPSCTAGLNLPLLGVGGCP